MKLILSLNLLIACVNNMKFKDYRTEQQYTDIADFLIILGVLNIINSITIEDIMLNIAEDSIYEDEWFTYH